MALADSSQAATTVSRFVGDGFHHEPDFRDVAVEYVPPRREVTTTFEVTPVQSSLVPMSATGDAEPTITTPKRTPPPNLHYVFDDPADGEPGRDRMLVHAVWEIVLAVALAVVGYLLYRQQPAAFNGDGLRNLALSVTPLGLVAAAAALTLRAGAPNLAVGAVAAAAGLYRAEHAGSGLQQSLVVVVGLCAAVGLVQGLLVVGLQVPAWAVGLAAGIGLLAWASTRATVTLTGGYDPLPHAYYWFGGFCALSLAGSLVGLIPVIRRGFARFRPVADPAQRRGVVAGVIVVGATVGSNILAGAGGVLGVLVAARATTSDGIVTTALALGAALLGGTSAFGRRGGIFGTIFATTLITLVIAYTTALGRPWPVAGYAAAAIGIGLAVTRLVERYGRPSLTSGDEREEDWEPKIHALSAPARSWQPATTPTPAGGLWASDDAWGSIEPR